MAVDHAHNTCWPFKNKKLVIQDEMDLNVKNQQKITKDHVNGQTNGNAQNGRTCVNSIYPVNGVPKPKGGGIVCHNGKMSVTSITAVPAVALKSQNEVMHRVNQVKIEDDQMRMSQISQDVCNGQASVYLPFDPKSAEEGLFQLADEDQPIVARCFARGTHPDSQEWFHREREMKHCLYPSSVYDQMLSNSLKDLGILQSKLDKDIVNVRNSPVMTEEEIDRKLQDMKRKNAQEKIVKMKENETKVEIQEKCNIEEKSPKKWNIFNKS